jgi:hypothetical protein
MDMESVWQNIKPETQVAPARTSTLKPSGKNPLDRIQSMLWSSTLLGTAILIFYVFLFFWYPIIYVRIAIVLVGLFSAWIVITGYKVYRGLLRNSVEVSSVLTELEFHYRQITSWINNQEMVAIFFYPVSISGGFLLGGVIGSGLPVEEFMKKGMLWLILIVTNLVLTPLCYLAVRYIFKLGFGKHLGELKLKIEQLKSAE